MPCPYCRKKQRQKNDAVKFLVSVQLAFSYVGTGIVFMTAWPAGPVLLEGVEFFRDEPKRFRVCCASLSTLP